jgi:hypothetical protein
MVCFTYSISWRDINRPLCGEANPETDWLDDSDLSLEQRGRCADVAVPRIGHARRRCWPADEVRGVLGEPQP